MNQIKHCPNSSSYRRDHYLVVVLTMADWMRNKEHARRVGGCHVSGARPSSDHFISCGRLYFQK